MRADAAEIEQKRLRDPPILSQPKRLMLSVLSPTVRCWRQALSRGCEISHPPRVRELGPSLA